MEEESKVVQTSVESSLLQPSTKRLPRTKKPNYNAIHADPLPVPVTPGSLLPSHNPFTLVYILLTYSLERWLIKAPAEACYQGFLSRDSQSVNIRESAHARNLWNKGFFGKGTLSRSEPTWLIRTRRRHGLIEYNDGITAEELTERRRVERREFKKERARKEQEKIRQQLLQEGKLDGDVTIGGETIDGSKLSGSGGNDNKFVSNVTVTTLQQPDLASTGGPTEIREIEHLQLTLEEAFFLCYALGALSVLEDENQPPLTVNELFQTCCTLSIVPRTFPTAFQAENPFILSYVAYHHYRSLGWVIKSGTKFTVNFLLYNRGPAFSHAEFAVIVLPSYSHQYWMDSDKSTARWDWMHCVNRVCSQVKKTVLLCYVDIPPPDVANDVCGVSSLLAKYSVREVSVKRWLPSRNRD